LIDTSSNIAESEDYRIFQYSTIATTINDKNLSDLLPPINNLLA